VDRAKDIGCAHVRLIIFGRDQILREVVAQLLRTRHRRVAGVRRRQRGGSGTGQGGDEAAAQAGEMSWRSTGARGRSSDVVEGEARPAALLEPTASRWSMRRRSWQCVRGSAGADGIDGAGGVQRFGRDATCRRFFFGEFYMCSI
jgi:hypothetical protein